MSSKIVQLYIINYFSAMFLVIQVGEPGVVKQIVPESFTRCGSYIPGEN